MSRRLLNGVVVAKSGLKTVAVEVTSIQRHPLYDKKITRSKRYLAHDESNVVVVGQKVTIEETRPLSARKRWLVVTKKENV